MPAARPREHAVVTSLGKNSLGDGDELPRTALPIVRARSASANVQRTLTMA
jgi:hypothetical protein